MIKHMLMLAVVLMPLLLAVFLMIMERLEKTALRVPEPPAPQSTPTSSLP